MDWKPAQFEIATKDGPRSRLGFSYGLFGINIDMGSRGCSYEDSCHWSCPGGCGNRLIVERFSVTHIPTGYKAAEFESLFAAIKFVGLIVTWPFWNKLTNENLAGFKPPAEFKDRLPEYKKESRLFYENQDAGLASALTANFGG